METGTGALQFAASTYSANENGGSLTIAAVRNVRSIDAVSVTYATASGTATAGTDHTTTSGTLNWANGDTAAKSFTVPIIDAGVFGGMRSFTVALDAVTGSATLGANSSALVTIKDNDVQTSYYVSPTGNDTTGNGSIAPPFATLAKAQSSMRASSTIKTAQLLGGTYHLTTPLALTSADNGENWQAAAGGTPVISGVTVTGWTGAGNGTWHGPISVNPGTDLEISGQRQMPAALGFDPYRTFVTSWHIVPCCNAPATGLPN